MRVVVVLALALVAAQAAAARPGATFCRGGALRGTFTVVRGSEGAGNIVYRLTLRNESTSSCTLSGLPVAGLRGANGAALPTHVRAAQPGRGTAALVILAPGAAASATARFSPDVPGVGEGGRRVCEPVAHQLVVTPNGGGRVVVAITPPTSVCEHGQLSFSLYSR